MSEAAEEYGGRGPILPTLIISISSIDPPSLIISIGLIEVASAFGVSVGLAGQIRSAGSVLAIVAALAMGVLSVRYSYKSLLLGGLLVNLVSSICCALAPSFVLLVACFSVMGLVTSLVTPMVFSYIGECYPGESRAQVVGTLTSLRTVSYLLMVQLIGLVVGFRGWRSAFLLLAAPITILGLALSLKVLPGIRGRENPGRVSLIEGYRGVLASRSAVACLIGNMLAGGAWAGGVIVYTVTYLREAFLLPRSEASNVFSGLVIGVIAGNYLGGPIIKRLGGKRVMVVSCLLTGILEACYMNSPVIQLTVAIVVVMSVLAGIVMTSTNTLLLDQVPLYRGTVTSVNSAVSQLGVALGAALGGLVLQLQGWGTVGVVFGAMHFVASIVYYVGVQNREREGREV
jgi:predicted MFS family arabinose efflux permease